MNIKLSGILAAGMLAMMALAPMGLAHRDDPATFADANADNKNDNTVNMVSGVVVGAADPRLQLVDADLDLSLGNGLCDMEVVDGGGLLDEPYVDGYVTGGALVAEGQWDDGGIGAVCHTTNMDGENYDTWGCDYGKINTVDRVTMAAVWVIAGCDWGYATGGSTFDPTPLPGIDAFQDCAVNDAVLGFPSDPATVLAGCVTDLAAYALSYDAGLLVTCLTTPALCPGPTGGSFSCQTGPGAGNTQNGQSFEDTSSGYADGTADSPTDDTGVEYPVPVAVGTVTCNDNQGMASMFVYNSVIVDSSAAVPVAVVAATIVDVTSDPY